MKFLKLKAASGNSSNIPNDTTGGADIESQTKGDTKTMKDDGDNDYAAAAAKKKKWMACVQISSILVNLGILGFSSATIYGVVTDYHENMASTTSSYRQEAYTRDYSMALGMIVSVLVMGIVGLVASSPKNRCILSTSNILYCLSAVLFSAVGGSNKNMTTFGFGLLLLLPVMFQGKLLAMRKELQDLQQQGENRTEETEGDSSNSSIPKSSTTTSSTTTSSRSPSVTASSGTTSLKQPSSSTKQNHYAKNTSITTTKSSPLSKKKGLPSQSQKRSSSGGGGGGGKASPRRKSSESATMAIGKTTTPTKKEKPNKPRAANLSSPPSRKKKTSKKKKKTRRVFQNEASVANNSLFEVHLRTLLQRFATFLELFFFCNFP